jgi:hypothetical protein
MTLVGVLRAGLIGGLMPALSGLVWRASMRTRQKEQDPSGDPVMRFIGAPYLMAVCAMAFMGVGIYQWFVPDNHRYSGNLELLCYAPTAVGIFTFLCAIYFASYHVVLKHQTITTTSWPFGTHDFDLKKLTSMNETSGQTFFHFNDGRKLAISHLLSGRQDFMEKIKERGNAK